MIRETDNLSLDQVLRNKSLPVAQRLALMGLRSTDQRNPSSAADSREVFGGTIAGTGANDFRDRLLAKLEEQQTSIPFQEAQIDQVTGLFREHFDIYLAEVAIVDQGNYPTDLMAPVTPGVLTTHARWRGVNAILQDLENAFDNRLEMDPVLHHGQHSSFDETVLLMKKGKKLVEDGFWFQSKQSPEQKIAGSAALWTNALVEQWHALSKAGSHRKRDVHLSKDVVILKFMRQDKQGNTHQIAVPINSKQPATIADYEHILSEVYKVNLNQKPTKTAINSRLAKHIEWQVYDPIPPQNKKAPDKQFALEADVIIHLPSLSNPEIHNPLDYTRKTLQLATGRATISADLRVGADGYVDRADTRHKHLTRDARLAKYNFGYRLASRVLAESREGIVQQNQLLQVRPQLIEHHQSVHETQLPPEWLVKIPQEVIVFDRVPVAWLQRIQQNTGRLAQFQKIIKIPHLKEEFQVTASDSRLLFAGMVAQFPRKRALAHLAIDGNKSLHQAILALDVSTLPSVLEQVKQAWKRHANFDKVFSLFAQDNDIVQGMGMMRDQLYQSFALLRRSIKYAQKDQSEIDIMAAFAGPDKENLFAALAGTLSKPLDGAGGMGSFNELDKKDMTQLNQQFQQDLEGLVKPGEAMEDYISIQGFTTANTSKYINLGPGFARAMGGQKVRIQDEKGETVETYELSTRSTYLANLKEVYQEIIPKHELEKNNGKSVKNLAQVLQALDELPQKGWRNLRTIALNYLTANQSWLKKRMALNAQDPEGNIQRLVEHIVGKVHQRAKADLTEVSKNALILSEIMVFALADQHLQKPRSTNN